MSRKTADCNLSEWTQCGDDCISPVIGHSIFVWKPELCNYIDQVNEADLMSNGPTGAVTAEEWNTLLEKYRAH